MLFAVQNELGRFRNEKQYADSFEQKLNEKLNSAESIIGDMLNSMAKELK
jgi:hypothetical protein